MELVSHHIATLVVGEDCTLAVVRSPGEAGRGRMGGCGCDEVLRGVVRGVEGRTATSDKLSGAW